MKVQTKFAEAMDANALFRSMNEQKPQQVGSMRARIAKAVEERRAEEMKDSPEGLSKDFSNVEAWTESEALARFFLALKIDPRAYLLMHTMSAEERVKRGFDPNAATRNLKAYKKVLEIAEYIADGRARCENVVKTFVACMIKASKVKEVVDRETAERFLSSIDLKSVSPDLAEAVSEYQAKHMTGGAATQTSQTVLTLSNLGAFRIVTDGRRKHVKVNRDSIVLEALATRFGMLEDLSSNA
jgi:hypothetical protein